jgi:hypothetical protein
MFEQLGCTIYTVVHVKWVRTHLCIETATHMNISLVSRARAENFLCNKHIICPRGLCFQSKAFKKATRYLTTPKSGIDKSLGKAETAR